jgi:ATP-dependent helicase/nuclease subunit B
MFGYLQSTDVVPAKNDFQALLAHTRRKLGELADTMLDGEISVNPCRIGKFSPCSWCEMAAVCRFEMGLSDARFLEPLKRLEVIRRISASTDRSS